MHPIFGPLTSFRDVREHGQQLADQLGQLLRMMATHGDCRHFYRQCRRPARPAAQCSVGPLHGGDWAEAVASLGIKRVSFHTLAHRHTHASQLIDANVEIVKISKRLGHAYPSITLRVYAHLFRRRDDISAEVINTALADIKMSRP